MPSEIVMKSVFGRQNGLCAFPKCNAPLIVEVDGEDTIVGQLAHIVSDSRQGPRGHVAIAEKDRDKAINFVGLCGRHHKVVDDHPQRYPIAVMLAMKADCERRNAPKGNPVKEWAPAEEPETVHSTMLWIEKLPERVYSARTTATGNKEVSDAMAGGTNHLTPFILRDGRLHTFHKLHRADNPFVGAYTEGTVETHEAVKLWEDPEGHRRYVALLNRTMTLHLGRKGMRFDPRHGRHYFRIREPGQPVTWTYTSKTGRSQTRDVVREKKRKDGTSKGEWEHLALRCRFERVAPRSWMLTIRPEFHMTTDGEQSIPHDKIGAKITRRKSHLYNDSYLGLVHFWRGVLSGEKPQAVLLAGQPIVIDAHLATTAIDWPGVPDDVIGFEPDPYPDDLLSMAELATAAEMEGRDYWDDDEDDDEDGEDD